MAIFDWFGKKSQTINSPDDLVKHYASFFRTLSNVQVTPETAMECPTVFACVRVLSTIMASLPLDMYRKTGDGKREQVESHPVLNLLGSRPNDWQTGFTYWQMVMTQLMLHGNHYAFKSKGASGPVRQLLPLNPSQTKVEQNKDWTIEYQLPGESGKTKRDKVFHLTGMTMDGVTGISPVHKNREAIGLSIALERHQNTSLANGLALEGTLETDNQLSDPAYARLKQEMIDRFKGADKSGGTMILEEGLKYNKLAQSFVDAQLLESRKHQRHEIAGIWGVPPHKVADLERATFTNIEHQNLDFVIDVLDPFIVNIEQQMCAQFFSEKERENCYLKFNVDALLRGDLKSRFDAYGKGIQWGFMSPNEARAKEDMQDRDDGDVFLQPTNMVPAPWSPDGSTQTPKEEGDE